jgi:hypothetical protein
MKRLIIPFRPVVLFACMVLISLVSGAQDFDPAQLPDNNDPVNAPIDGGVSLLVAAGIGYGAKKAHDTRNKNKPNERKE